MVVEIKMLGINEVMRRLQQANIKINEGADFGVVRAGAFMEEEVKQSIAGNRAEPRSVKTGLFANSIEFEKTGDKTGLVKSSPTPYPNNNLTTGDIAVLMENKRHHFSNTNTRNKLKVKEIIEQEIKNKV